MGEDGRWDEDHASGRELDEEFKFFKNEMATLGMVEVSQTLNCAPTEWAIHAVAMGKGTRVGTEVEGC